MQRLRATCMLARTMWKSRKLHMAHVKAHAGHVGNEVADLVARMVRIGKLEAREPPIAHPLWYHGAPPRILNAWLLWEGIDQPTHLPPIATTHLEVPHTMPQWVDPSYSIVYSRSCAFSMCNFQCAHA